MSTRPFEQVCARGHAFTPENTIVRPSGKRRCRTCDLTYKRERGKRLRKSGIITADIIRASVNPERFWANVDRTSGGGCWNWTGNHTRGYGRFAIVKLQTTGSAHRIAWALDGRDLDPALQLDHLCRNPSCVNPAHLEQVTSRVNALRSESPWAKNAAKTECKRGHQFTPDNTHVRADGARVCRTCARDRARAAYNAKRGCGMSFQPIDVLIWSVTRPRASAAVAAVMLAGAGLAAWFSWRDRGAA